MTLYITGAGSTMHIQRALRPESYVVTGHVKVLSSWKEIASYMSQAVRTVQRWEAHLGLPVHRPQGEARSRVIAFPTELDGWLAATPCGRGQDAAVAAKVSELMAQIRKLEAENKSATGDQHKSNDRLKLEKNPPATDLRKSKAAPKGSRYRREAIDFGAIQSPAGGFGEWSFAPTSVQS